MSVQIPFRFFRLSQGPPLEHGALHEALVLLAPLCYQEEHKTLEHSLAWCITCDKQLGRVPSTKADPSPPRTHLR